MSRLRKIASQFDKNDIKNKLDPIIIDLYKAAADEFIYDKVAKGEAEESDIDGFLKENVSNPNIDEYVSISLSQDIEVLIDKVADDLEKIYNYLLEKQMEKEFKDYKNK